MPRSLVSCVYLLVLFLFLTKCRILLEPSWEVRNLAQYIESVLGFFVVEAKDREVTLDDHVPPGTNATQCGCDKTEVWFLCSFSDSI